MTYKMHLNRFLGGNNIKCARRHGK